MENSIIGYYYVLFVNRSLLKVWTQFHFINDLDSIGKQRYTPTQDLKEQPKSSTSNVPLILPPTLKRNFSELGLALSETPELAEGIPPKKKPEIFNFLVPTSQYSWEIETKRKRNIEKKLIFNLSFKNKTFSHLLQFLRFPEHSEIILPKHENKVEISSQKKLKFTLSASFQVYDGASPKKNEIFFPFFSGSLCRFASEKTTGQSLQKEKKKSLTKKDSLLLGIFKCIGTRNFLSAEKILLDPWLVSVSKNKEYLWKSTLWLRSIVGFTLRTSPNDGTEATKKKSLFLNTESNQKTSSLSSIKLGTNEIFTSNSTIPLFNLSSYKRFSFKVNRSPLTNNLGESTTSNLAWTFDVRKRHLKIRVETLPIYRIPLWLYKNYGFSFRERTRICNIVMV